MGAEDEDVRPVPHDGDAAVADRAGRAGHAVQRVRHPLQDEQGESFGAVGAQRR